QEIFRATKDATSVLDVGAGDGTKLAHMGGVRKVGTEVTDETVALARKKHPKFTFVKAFGEKLPIKDNSFDAVTCLFVLEHTQNPEQVISEIIRVTTPGGKFFLLAPNFGAPNRASPNFKGSRWKKLALGLINDFKNQKSLTWQKVRPQEFSIDDFKLDLDTTVEPYLGSLIKYLGHKNIKIIKATSFWNMELTSASLMQKFFKLFEKNWGPHLFVIGEKQ
ncbi:MAG: class I SAM-dependent methyltransferase, partial [archaeon]|nr:class I SAM-dependent methyltransferase [archaeon]